MSRHQSADHLVWRTTEVEGRRVRYGVGGHGLPVLFLHGWALGSHAYKRALKRLVRMGCRVYAPSLPGFGGSGDLQGSSDMIDYAAWAAGFLEAVGVDEPVLAVGHSFGGAVATRLTHDCPERVAHLVLIGAIGAGTWSQSGDVSRTLAERPLWHWALHFPIDIAIAPGAIPTVSAILEDAVPNLLHNPIAMWRTGMLARRADLNAELATICAHGIHVSVLWGESDLIVPRASFEAICRTLGICGRLVPGGHSWLLADPDTFAEVMAEPVTAAAAARTARIGLSARPA
jgi:pimeloyl-ACP methyl ester carboxylesterase